MDRSLHFICFRAACSILFFFISSVLGVVNAQVNGKAKTLYDKAQKELSKKNTEKAIGFLKQAVTTDPQFVEANMALYKIYLDQGLYLEALQQIGAAAQIKSKDQPSLLFNAGRLALQLGEYTASQKYLGTYLDLNTKDTTTRRRAIQYFHTVEFANLHLSPKVKFEPKPLGPVINTAVPEYLPALDGTNNTLVFTRRFSGQEDLWLASKKAGDTMWTTVQPWTQNTTANEGAHVISADGKTIVFTRCGTADSYGSCDLYSSDWRLNKWTKPVNMGRTINSTAWESQPSLSANGRTLYFVSDRVGGLGGYDIWVSKKSNRGWSRPENAGAHINTAYDELSPFLHPDNQHLYFRSDGWPGFGSKDLFVSTKPYQKEWEFPINLGYPINDHQDQGAMVVALDGRTAILTQQTISIQNQLLSSDLIEFKLPDGVQSFNCKYVQGRVVNAQTRESISLASIAIIDSTQKGYSDTVFSDQDGGFLLVLPIDQTYKIICQADSFDFFSDRISITGYVSNRPEYDIGLTKITTIKSNLPDHPIVLKNVLFEFGSAILMDESMYELEVLFRFLNSNPDLKATIEGHTDNVGIAAKNKALSFGRAKAVYDYLIAKHIAVARLQYIGHGDSMPKVANDSEEHRAINRRVEIKLSKS